MDSSNPSEDSAHSIPHQGQGDEQGDQSIIRPTKADQEKPSNTPTRAKKKKRPTKHFVRISNLVIQGLLLFVGVGYSWFAWKQWTVMNQQLQMTQIDQRAWISIRRAVLMQPLAANKKPLVDIVVENSGRTPAINVSGFAVLYAGTVPNYYDGSLRSKEITAYVIGPNNTFHGRIEMSREITQEEISDIVTTKSKTLYVAGWIEYCDIFRIQHMTKFCGEMNEIGVPSVVKENGELEGTRFYLCDTGNEIDNEKQKRCD